VNSPRVARRARGFAVVVAVLLLVSSFARAATQNGASGTGAIDLGLATSLWEYNSDGATVGAVSIIGSIGALIASDEAGVPVLVPEANLRSSLLRVAECAPCKERTFTPETLNVTGSGGGLLVAHSDDGDVLRLAWTAVRRAADYTDRSCGHASTNSPQWRTGWETTTFETALSDVWYVNVTGSIGGFELRDSEDVCSIVFRSTRGNLFIGWTV